jgi:hypothetical protein
MAASDVPTAATRTGHAWATACHDTDVRELTQRRTAHLWQAAQRISGADDRRILQLVASGMLINLMAAIDLPPVKQRPGVVRSP